MKKLLAVPWLLTLFAPAAGAGWLGDVLLGAGEEMGNRFVRESADKAYESAKGTLSRRDENRPEFPAGAKEEKGEERLPGKGKEPAGPPAGRGPVPSKPGIRPSDVLSRYDFLPGERVLFFDDFRNTDVGGFPRRWTIKGPDTNRSKTPIEVARYGGGHWARYRPSNEKADVVTSFYVRLNVGKDMPEKFTVEFDAVLPPYNGSDQPPQYRVLMINNGREYQHQDYKSAPANVVRIGSAGAGSGNTNLDYERGDGQVHRVSIGVNGNSVKAYLDEELVVNDPEGVVRPVTVLGMELSYQTGPHVLPLMFSNFRVAGGGKDMKAALDTDGRIVTRGILFDTGSDVILPASIPTLSAVGTVLRENPSLKLTVEGHTDDQGTPEINQLLSERRARAVADWLRGQGIAPERIRAKGWGSTRPVDGNDLAEGRANNRRVEFVKGS